MRVKCSLQAVRYLRLANDVATCHVGMGPLVCDKPECELMFFIVLWQGGVSSLDYLTIFKSLLLNGHGISRVLYHNSEILTLFLP